MAHIAGLPADSAFVRNHRDVGGWSEEAFLLAGVGDELRTASYYLAHLAGAKAELPKPFPRPNTVEPKRADPTIDDLRQFFREA